MGTHFTKKNLLVSLSVLVILVLPQISHAQVADAVGGAIQSLLYNFVVVVFGMLVRFGGMLLDAGIEYFVIGFGDVFNNSGVGLAVNDTWVIIRDFINLFFIFGLVYIGIRMILDSDNSNTRRWLVNLIMAALLVNFSLFATKFVVDFSNKLATEIADAGLGADKDPKTGAYTANVSGELMLRMGITTALGGETTAMPANAGWGYIFGIAILFMVSAFVFAAGGILLIIRFAVICLYLVLSPVMFASWVLPGLSDTMNRYWKDFIKRCFVAPIYLTFIYFSFQIMGGLQQTIKGSGEGANATNFANPNWSATLGASSPNTVQDSTLGTLPFFVLICIFMIASLVAANKLGAEGAGKAISIGKKLNNKVQSGVKRGAGSVTFGLAAKGGQAGVGGLANAASNNRRFQNFAANNKLGRAALAGTRKVADASFDARRVGGLGKELGIGEGKKGGFVTAVKAREKKDEEFMKSLTDANMEDPRNQQRASHLAEETEAEADAILEANNKETADLTVEIDDLGTEIEDLTNTLKEQIKQGTITSQEQYIAERTIVAKQNQKIGSTKVRDEKLQQEVLVDKINQAGLDASLATDPKIKTQMREQQQLLSAQLTNRVNSAQKMLNQAQSMFDEETGRSNGAAKRLADSEIKFENKIKFMQGVEKKSERSFTPLEKASFENLKKKFGANASAMASKDKESKASKKLVADLKALQESQNPTKKDDDK